MKVTPQLNKGQQPNDRRNFLKKMGLIAGMTAIGGTSTAKILSNNQVKAGSTSMNQLLKLSPDPKTTVFKPLQEVSVTGSDEGARLALYDGQGQLYWESSTAKKLSFKVGAALGTHHLFLFDKKDRLLDLITFQTTCKTEINDETGEFKRLTDTLYWTLIWKGRIIDGARYNGKFYEFFVRWLRDHVHTMKGMKYFYQELKTGIDLYYDTQRQDGMIFDNIYPRTDEVNYWQQRFSYGDFYEASDDKTYEMKRIPVENDVEYLYLEGLYYTWKATGDDVWMKERLDSALKALNYSITDPYRWSEKYQLLKRGYTIDTWDFQSSFDVAISGDPMVVYTDKTKFGVMFGDNTGMAVGCQYLAEMLDYAGRNKEAEKIRQTGKDLKNRLDKLSWNGDYYTHHVPEDPNFKRDFGIDTDKQVSLSNAYSLNRDLTHEQCVAIIKTYQRIRQEMPDTSPGEWYTIYPPFERGYGGHNSKWEYMNAGVTSIVAGELAHGAFEHGFESYGVDILRRTKKLAEKTKDYLYCTYRGAMPRRPKTNFTPVSLKTVANVDFKGEGAKGVIGWTNEGTNDLHEMPTGSQEFEGVPFDIVDPAKNGRKACLGISSQEGYKFTETLPVNKKAKALYLLHAMGKGRYAGTLTFNYTDGSTATEVIGQGKVGNWWFPTAPEIVKTMPRLRVAWEGKNDHALRVGVYIYCMNNPQPDKEIKSLNFEGVKNGNQWMVLGLTLADQEAYLPQSIVSAGIPDNWGAGAVTYALFEGLAGVKDTGVAFKKALLAPRWPSAGVNKVSSTIKYEASEGYMSYDYRLNNNKLDIVFTGTAHNTEVKLLLPKGKSAKSLRVDAKDSPMKTEKVEQSQYAVFTVEGLGVHQLELSLA